MTAPLKLVSSALAHGSDHLGDLVWWSLADARVDRPLLEAFWRDAALDVGLLPEEPTAERALKQAVREAQVGQRERLIRLGLESETEVVFAIVRERRDATGNVAYDQEARVHLDRSREVLTSDAPSHDLVQAVIAGFRALRTTHTADDVRRAIVKALGSWSAVTLRESGGIYWVPAPFASQARRLQAAVQRIGTSAMSVLPVHRSAEAEATLGEVARASIEDELAQLQTEIDAFMVTPPERASTLTRRLDAFEVLRDRAKLYRNVLAIQVTDLDHDLDRMAVTVEQLLSHKKAA